MSLFFKKKKSFLSFLSGQENKLGNIIEDCFHNLFELSPFGNTIIKTNGTIYANQAFCDLIGYTQKELEAKTIFDITHPDDVMVTKEHMKKLQLGEISKTRFEKRYIHKNGNIIWVDKSIYIQLGADNNPVFFTATTIDITARRNAEEALAAQAEELKIIFDNVPAWIFFKDTSNRFIRVNKAFADVMNMTREELEGKSLFDIFPTSQAEAYWKDDKEVIHTGKAKINIVETTNINEKTLWVQTNKIPYRNQKGEIIGIIGFTIDITERLNAEDNTRKAKEELELFFDLVPDMVCITSPQGYFTTVNEAWTNTLGFSKEELVSIPFMEFIHPDDVASTQKEIKKRLDGLSTMHFTNRYRCADGSFKFLEWVASPSYDGFLYAAARDVTDRILAEEALHESETKYHSLFEVLPVGVLITDKRLKVVEYNKLFKKMLRLTTKEIANNSLEKRNYIDKNGVVLQFKDFPSHKAFQQNKLISGVEMGIVFENNEVLWTSVSAIPIPLDKFGVAIVLTDISAQKHAEKTLKNVNQELQELNATKDKLFSIIGHDIKGPLGSILGFAGLLNKNIQRYDLEKTLVFVDYIATASKQTITLLENLLLWAKTQTGQLKACPEELNLKLSIYEIVNVLTSSAKLKNIDLQYIYEDITIYTDESMLQTIVRNLLSNAIKFTNPGGCIQIKTYVENENAIINIEDEGVGMDPKTVDKLFKIGETESTRGTANEKGTGLGLILCKELTEALGGKIWVESKVGVGSKFHISLPLVI